MWTKLSQRLFAIALVGSTLGLIGLDVRAAQAEGAQACIAFDDANYKGAGRGLRANESTPMTTMNDRISSFKIRGDATLRCTRTGIFKAQTRHGHKTSHLSATIGTTEFRHGSACALPWIETSRAC
jgi:hypothetical protein